MKHSEKARANNPQVQINHVVENALERMNNEFRWYDNAERLRYCSAWIYKTQNFKVLRSYNTIIACIDMQTGTGYDFLRLVYGYTATSAQHISKFFHDCAAQRTLTWRAV